MKPFIEHDEDEILGKAYDGRLMRRLLPYLRLYRRRLTIAVIFLLGPDGDSFSQFVDSTFFGKQLCRKE